MFTMRNALAPQTYLHLLFSVFVMIVLSAKHSHSVGSTMVHKEQKKVDTLICIYFVHFYIFSLVEDNRI